MKQRSAPRGKAAQLNALLALCAELSPSDASLVRAVELAVTDPDRYVAKHGDEDLDEPFAALRWYVLAKRLATRRLCLRIDWKHPADDALAQLKRLRGAPAALKRLDGAELGIDDLDTGQFLEVLGRTLRERSDATLAGIDTVSDSYSLVLIPTKQSRALAALATRAGGELDLFTGAGLAELTRFRDAREQREDRKWYREQPHFLRGEGRKTEVTHLMIDRTFLSVSRHVLTAPCKQTKRRQFATPGETRRAVTAEIQGLLRAGWRRVHRPEYIATFQRLAGIKR